MVEIISSILEAEKKAEEKVNISIENAKEIKEEGDFSAEKIKNDAVALQRVHQKKVLNDATNKAEEQYAKILVDGENDAKKIIDNARLKVESVSIELLKEFLG